MNHLWKKNEDNMTTNLQAVISFLALMLSLFAVYRAYKTEKTSKLVEIEGILSEVWGLMGGDNSRRKILTFSDRGSLSQAYNKLEICRKINPNHWKTHYMLGLYHLGMETKIDFEESERCFKKAIKLRPKESLIYSQCHKVNDKVYSSCNVPAC